MPKKKQPIDVPRDLWVIASKIRGLGEIFSMCTGDPPLSDEGIKGISHLLMECANRLDEMRNDYEENQ